MLRWGSWDGGNQGRTHNSGSRQLHGARRVRGAGPLCERKSAGRQHRSSVILALAMLLSCFFNRAGIGGTMRLMPESPIRQSLTAQLCTRCTIVHQRASQLKRQEAGSPGKQQPLPEMSAAHARARAFQRSPVARRPRVSFAYRRVAVVLVLVVVMLLETGQERLLMFLCL